MSSEKKEQIFCSGCGQWHDSHHMSIHNPRNLPNKCSAGGGQELINLETGKDYCTACGGVGDVENTVFYCSCGHVQKPIYEDSTALVEVDENVLVTDGQNVYLATYTNAYLIGQRRYINIRGV